MTTNLFTLPDVEWNNVFDDGYFVAYTAERFGSSWNGAATPVVSHRVMTALVARMQFQAVVLEGIDDWRWDGNGVRVVPWDCDANDDTDATWVLPDTDGLYDLGVLGYTWVRLDDDDRVFQEVE